MLKNMGVRWAKVQPEGAKKKKKRHGFAPARTEWGLGGGSRLAPARTEWGLWGGGVKACTSKNRMGTLGGGQGLPSSKASLSLSLRKLAYPV